MEIIGLIKEYDQKKAKSYFEYQKNCLYDHKVQILNYLRSGICFAVTMKVVQSLIPNDKNIIGGISYYTDGYWIWPNYIVYYFEKESIELPKGFITSILNRKIPPQDKIDPAEAINFLKESGIT